MLSRRHVSFDRRGVWPHVLLVREPLQVGRARVPQVRPVQRESEEALQEGRGVPLLHLEALRYQKRSVYETADFFTNRERDLCMIRWEIMMKSL